MAVLKKQNSSEWKSHQIFGFSVYSNFQFNNRFPVGNGKRDLTFDCNINDNRKTFWEHTQPSYASSNCNAKGESTFYIYRKPGMDILVFNQLAVFYVWPDRIVCKPLVDDQERLVEIYLLGAVFSYWIELQGIITLHASAVSIEDRAVAFLSYNEGGKSSMAASLVQHGYALTTDDLLPIENAGDNFICRPGHPQMRMWPELARHFLGEYEHLKKVHPSLSKRLVPIGNGVFGKFNSRKLKLGRIYLPQRYEHSEKSGKIEISPVNPARALFELVRHSFLPRVMKYIDLDSQRFDTFSRIVSNVPIRKIRYPSGFNYLPHVREAILKDLDDL